MHTTVPSESRRGRQIPGIVSSYELACGYCEQNLGPLEEQAMLLTTGASLQHPIYRYSEQYSLTTLLLPSWQTVEGGQQTVDSPTI